MEHNGKQNYKKNISLALGCIKHCIDDERRKATDADGYVRNTYSKIH